MLDTFLALHWGWYIPMYFATGTVLTLLFLAFLPSTSDIYENIVKFDSPPAPLIAILWPLALVAGLLASVWVGLDAAFSKAARFDPQKLNPRHRLKAARYKRHAEKQTESQAIAESTPSWARWH